MNSRIPAAPGRAKNSRNGSTTASFSVLGRLRGQFRFRCEKGGGHPDDERAGHQEIDDAPRHPVGEDQGDRARGEHRHAVPEDVHPRSRSQFLRGEDLGAPGVDHDVLARAAEGDEERQERQRAGMRLRLGERHRGDDEEEGRLGHQHPPAATPEERGDEPVHQRGPEVLERVRQADEGEDPDHRQVDLFGRHPRLQGRAGQRQRDPGGETEQQDEEDAPVPERVQQRGHAGYRTTEATLRMYSIFRDRRAFAGFSRQLRWRVLSLLL